MKRDMDLIRKILLEIEKAPYTGVCFEISLDGVSQDDLSYHLGLLAEARLIVGTDLTTPDGPRWQPIRLTWQGHEFLDARRDETIGKKGRN